MPAVSTIFKTAIVAVATLLAAVVVPSLALAAAPSSAARAKAHAKNAPFTKPEHVLAFINGYREDKQPERVPDAVKAMGNLGLIREPEESGIYIGFVAGVIGESGDGARKLVTRMFPMPPEDQVILIKAIAFSGRDDWKELLGAFVERMPARKVLLDRYLYRDAPLVDGLMTEASGAFAVDVYWGLYFATGDARPAQRIIKALAWTAERNSVEKLTIGSMAKWTLATNATRDKGLRDIMKAELNEPDDNVRRPLAEVIEAAETFETARIKRDALKAIEELKLKGPQSKRDTVWWGQAGQTALALGCVAAAAVGQVEFGIPCVIGGALSSAALKYLVPQ